MWTLSCHIAFDRWPNYLSDKIWKYAILPSTPMLDSSPTSAELYSTRENYYYYNSLLWAFRGPRICIQDAAALKEENQCVDIYDK